MDIQGIRDYANGLGADDVVRDWLERCVFSKDDVINKETQSDIEHVIDFLISDKRPKSLKKVTYKQIKDKTKKWNDALIKKGNHIKESKTDTEIILDFKDGFKFVKLVGRNAYKREGFLMRHCVESYFGKEDVMYSLRDKKNMPHATIAKSSQQIKGKGNGPIHPKYIHYVVEFLEHIGIDVRDSEMENIGYVNIEDIKDDNIDWGDSLFRGKYFPRSDINKIKDKSGNNYQSITLWRKFSLIFKGAFNFKFNLSLDYFLKSIKRNNFKALAGHDYNTILGKSFNTIVGRDNNTISGKHSNTIASKNFNTIAGSNCNTISGQDYNTIASKNFNTIAGQDYNTLAGHDYNTILGKSFNTIVGRDNNTISGKHSNTIVGKDYNTIVGNSDNTLAGRDCNTIASKNFNTIAGNNLNILAGHNYNTLVGIYRNIFIMTGKNNISVGRIGSIMKGAKGNVMVFSVEDDNGDLKLPIVVQVDGKKIKENVFYKLEGGKVIEAILNDEQKERVRKAEEAMRLTESITDFYEN
ncbi:MAG: hypothetical protein AB7P94_17285 [Steroidobacteraceae bacterium]